MKRLLGTLYGDVPVSLLPQVAWLSSMLFCIIGSFWLLDSLKDSVFATLVGLDHQPNAKIISVAVTLVIVFYYNKLLDSVSKITLFHIIGCGYTILFLIIGVALHDDTIGMENTVSSPYRLLGWVSYFAIESYGSLSVALFWAFTNSTINLEGAKSMYGLIIAFAQLGAVLGSTLATQASRFGVPALYVMGALSCLPMVGIVRGYAFVYAHKIEKFTNEEPRKDAGGKASMRGWESFWDGLRLILRYDYVLLILGISCLYEIVLTVLDYEMKVIGRARYGSDVDGSEQFAALMGHFGQATNIISCVFSLLGTSLVVRNLGLRRTLRVFPVLLTLTVIVSYFYPSLWVLFASISCLKALTYALNEPSKEMLYMPTSDLIKFKAKAWIDVFGARMAKALGSTITNTAKSQPELLVQYGSIPSLLVSFALFGISVLVGRQFEDLVAAGVVVGGETDRQDPLDSWFDNAMGHGGEGEFDDVTGGDGPYVVHDGRRLSVVK